MRLDSLLDVSVKVGCTRILHLNVVIENPKMSKVQYFHTHFRLQDVLFRS